MLNLANTISGAIATPVDRAVVVGGISTKSIIVTENLADNIKSQERFKSPPRKSIQLNNSKSRQEFATPLLFKKHSSSSKIEVKSDDNIKNDVFVEMAVDNNANIDNASAITTSGTKALDVNDSITHTLLYNHDVQYICLSAMFAYFSLAMLIDWGNVFLLDGCHLTIERTTGLIVSLEVSYCLLICVFYLITVCCTVVLFAYW